MHHVVSRILEVRHGVHVAYVYPIHGRMRGGLEGLNLLELARNACTPYATCLLALKRAEVSATSATAEQSLPGQNKLLTVSSN